MAVELGLKLDGSDAWTLPIEPQISIDGSNEVARRSVAKGYTHGTVKELWNRGDYEITLSGWFIMEPDEHGEVPLLADVVERLTDLLSAGKPLLLTSEPTRAVGISMVCPLTWSLPYTSGIQNQRYTIKFVSDHPFALLATEPVNF